MERYIPKPDLTKMKWNVYNIQSDLTLIALFSTSVTYRILRKKNNAEKVNYGIDFFDKFLELNYS